MSEKTDRRQMLIVLSGAPLAAAASAQQKPPGVATDRPLGTPPQSSAAPSAAPYKPKLLTVHEMRTVRVLADLILPADSRSGSASDAGVPEFIDAMLESRGGVRMAAQIRGGLVWLDREANQRFGKDFVACGVDQQKQIIDLIAYPAKAAPEHSQAVFFFNRFRDLTSSGFFSSKIGTKDLGFMGNVAVSEWNGCPTEVLKKIGLS